VQKKGKDCYIQDLGEFALIERLTEVLGPAGRGAGQGVIRGIGDDAAVLQNSPGTRLLAACDLLIEGVHFDLDLIPPRQLGWKALAVNLSDIAAMGGRPRWVLVSLGLKPGFTVGFVEEIYAGIAALAEMFGVTVVGGDTCSSPACLVIDLCVLGEARRTEIAYRSGAHEGDYLLVTGKIGAAAAGLVYLSAGKQRHAEPANPAELIMAQLQPLPRVREAAVLARSGLVGAMNDLSDGLASELHEIVQASGCGAQILAERLPVCPAAISLARQLGVAPLHGAPYGGEDYELLFTVPGGKGSPLKLRRLSRSLEKVTGTPLSMIGRVLPSSAGVTIVDPAGGTEPLLPKGFSHFKE
jgi:thiamine-monophosphate kinase